MNEMVKAPAAEAVSAVMPPALVAKAPDANTETMLSLMRRHGVESAVRRKLKFLNDPKTGLTKGWVDAVTGVDLTFAPSADHARALAACMDALAPAHDDQIDVWLTDLMLVSARRAADTDTVDLTMEAYIRRLRAYPGDLVREVLQGWSSKWFPTWAEMKDVLDERTAPREMIRAKLAGLMPEGRAPRPNDSGAPTAPKPRKTIEALKQERHLRKMGGLRFREQVPEGMDERDYIAADLERIDREIADLERQEG